MISPVVMVLDWAVFSVNMGALCCSRIIFLLLLPELVINIFNGSLNTSPAQLVNPVVSSILVNVAMLYRRTTLPEAAPVQTPKAVTDTVEPVSILPYDIAVAACGMTVSPVLPVNVDTGFTESKLLQTTRLSWRSIRTVAELQIARRNRLVREQARAGLMAADASLLPALDPRSFWFLADGQAGSSCVEISLRLFVTGSALCRLPAQTRRSDATF